MHLATKSLQKLPNRDRELTIQQAIIKKIICGEKLTKDQVRALSKRKQTALINALSVGLRTLRFNDRDNLVENISDIISDETKYSIWNSNHIKILWAIHEQTNKYNRFPTRQELSDATGISRTTIGKHLKQYYGSQQYHERQEEFSLMREKVLAKAFNLSMLGDTKAMRVFLEATSQLKPLSQIRNQQNNIIQINGVTITEDQLSELPPDKQVLIQEMLTNINGKQKVIV
jgi:hypothetical protein